MEIMKQLILKKSSQRISLHDRPICRLENSIINSFIEDNDSYVRVFDSSVIDLKHSKKLAAMVERKPVFANFNNANQVQLMWPTDMVFDEKGVYCGYVFDRINFKNYLPLNVFLTPVISSSKLQKYSYKDKIAVAYHFAALLSNLHQQSIYLIDLNPNHILIDVESLKPLIIACDELSIIDKSQARYAASHCNLLYYNPEDMKLFKPAERLGLDQDNYALAVLIFQIMNQGLHPYQGISRKALVWPKKLLRLIQEQQFICGIDARALSRDGASQIRPLAWSIYDYFDDETKKLFVRAFSKTEQRPSASEWQLHLNQYLSTNSAKLTQCKQTATHYHFLNGCGLCEKNNIRLPMRDRIVKVISTLSRAKSSFAEKKIKIY